MSRPLEQIHVATRAEWRAWLEANHRTSAGVWLVAWKAATGRPRVAYDDAVEEALCFGWIDSLVRRLDDERFAQKYTPRKPGGTWSPPNRQRARRLIAAGLMTASGAMLLPPDLDAPDPVTPHREDPVVLEAVEAALRADALAWQAFQRLAPSHRRNYLRWILDGKREETRARRAAEAIARLRQGLTVGLK